MLGTPNQSSKNLSRLIFDQMLEKEIIKECGHET